MAHVCFRRLRQLCTSGWRMQISNCSDFATKPRSDLVVVLNGLPYSATSTDVVQFFGNGIKVADGVNGVTLKHTRSGLPIGKAFVQLSSESDVLLALDKNNHYMGERYIEVFRHSDDGGDFPINRSNQVPRAFNRYMDNEVATGGGRDGWVKLRGVPYQCSEIDIQEFFTGFNINAISFPNSMQNRGQAYVEFSSDEVAQQAFSRNHNMIGHRYIEMFYSSKNTVDQFCSGGSFTQANPLPGGSSRRSTSEYVSLTGHSIHMIGVPYEANVADIEKFFEPIVPVQINIELWPRTGQPTGRANVDFKTEEDANISMEKDKQYIGSRYIELELRSKSNDMDEGRWEEA